MHINFGGKLTKPIVTGVIIPGFKRVVSHTQVYFANSIELVF